MPKYATIARKKCPFLNLTLEVFTIDNVQLKEILISYNLLIVNIIYTYILILSILLQLHVIVKQ